MKKRGPKPLIENSQNEYRLKEIILLFDENHNMKPKIGYKDIYEFVKMMYEKKDIDFKYPSYSWWKTTGKQLVDDFNKVKSKMVRVSEKEQHDVFLISDVVEKFGGAQKNDLRKHLEPIDSIMTRMENKINNLEENNKRLKQELELYKNDIKNSIRLNDKLQELVLSLFSYSNKPESGLINLLTTGSTKSTAVNLSLTKTFNDPVAYFNSLSQKIGYTAENNNNSNIVPIRDTDRAEINKDQIQNDFNYDY